MRWILVRNAVIAVNVVKTNISPHFTAFLTKIHREFHRISYKNSPHRLLWQINVRNAVKAVNAVKKKFIIFHRISYKNSPRNSPHFLQKFTAYDFKVYSIWFKFTWNFNDVSDSWLSGQSSWRHAGGQRYEPVWGGFFFIRKLRTRWKKIIHRNSPHSPQKNVRNTRWKLFFFHRISYKNSPRNLDPGGKNR